jgi:two-component system, OmpR family, copper resistance phosphate regulon response regulator CusR
MTQDIRKKNLVPPAILVVEDEEKTAGFLRQGLVEAGYSVQVVGDGREAVRLINETDFDFVVLDVMLPGLDGWSVLGEIRKTGKKTSVIFLSAKDEVVDRVKGLDLGADAYLVKPFSFSELLAVIRSIGRRSSEALNGQIKTNLLIADLDIDYVGHVVTRSGKRIELSPKEFTLLCYLAKNQGEVLSRVLIAKEVWNISFETNTNLIDVHIRRLRAKIDDDFEPKLIHSVRGVGYVFELRG